MEASQAGEAAQQDAAPEGQAQEGQQEGGEQTAAVTPEALQRIDQIAEQLPQIQEQIQNLQPPDAGDEGFEGDEGFGEPEGPELLYDEYGQPYDAETGEPIDPQQAEQAQLQQFVDQRVTNAVQEAIKPLLENQERQRIVQEADQLEGEFPELADPEKAGQAVETARGLAEQMGQPELAGDPKFVRLSYLAGKAEQLAAQETPAGSTQEAVSIEGGGGATPVSPEEDDTAQRILMAGRPNGQALRGLS